MAASASKATMTRSDRGPVARYGLRRQREPAARGVQRSPVVEEFQALDRAPLSALGYAFDGPTSSGERFTGSVSVIQVLWCGDRRARTDLIDLIDEPIAFRLLNEVRLPRPQDLTVSLDSIQSEIDALAQIGI